MDEFQEIKKELLNEFIRNISTLMTTNHEYGICILPFLSALLFLKFLYHP
jgi:p-aminobenzoyl-glutamate transporter AbgT